MIDFDADPELKKLRAEFVASLGERHQAVSVALARLRAGSEAPEVAELAHRIAGAAETFGFKELGAVAGKLEEKLDAGVSTLALADGVHLLADALAWTADGFRQTSEKARQAAYDRISSDPRWAKLF